MEETWDNNRKLEIDEPNYFTKKSDGLFHTGQCYEDVPAKTVYCKRCNGNNFNVGKGDYWTGIKCINCGWEQAIHSG